MAVHTYEVRPRKERRRVDLIADALPFGGLWYDGPNAVTNATGYARHDSRSADAVIRVYDETGNVIETHEHKGAFKRVMSMEWEDSHKRKGLRRPRHRGCLSVRIDR